MQRDNDSESIYQAPASDTAVAPEGDQMAIFVGPRFASHYANKFARFDNGALASWNWPAFFVTSFWLLYRKMWAYSLSYWFLLPLALAIVATAVSATQSNVMDRLIAFNIVYYGGYAMASLIILPIFANRIYYRHAKKKLAKVALKFPNADQQRLELARTGGTSNAALVVLPLILIFVIGILAAISIPAYQDYTIRAQVSEGLNLSGGAKAAVMEYHLDTQSLPANNAEAGLDVARNITGSYVASVRVENGTVVVTYGRDAHAVLAGNSIVLEPDIQSNPLSWNCYSETIADKHLPAACR